MKKTNYKDPPSSSRLWLASFRVDRVHAEGDENDDDVLHVVLKDFFWTYTYLYFKKIFNYK